MSGESLLEVRGLTMRFGGLTAVDGLDFTATRGSITAVIGPNGAGKTTVFNCLTGFYQPTAGTLLLRHPAGEVQLQRLPGHRVARLGVVRTFQNVRLFPRMTVLENLLVAQHRGLMRASGWSLLGLLGASRWHAAEAAAVEKARHWLERVGLLEVADEEAGNLSYGMQRRIEIARALCTDPLLLCLDEPAAGLNPRETHALGRLLQDIRRDTGAAILLIEHDMSLVMGISDRIVVVDHGRRIAEGTPDAVRQDERVIRAYLGEPDAPDAASC
jgi:branched-chain amino acid transport system ATP-binding protein